MKMSRRPELPLERQRVLRRAIVLEWLTIVFLVSATVLLYFVMGASQAMKTEWIEKLLGFVPPIMFLVSLRIRDWPPDKEYPYGYHRIVSIAFLAASLALLAMGGYLLIDALVKLIRAEHPTIGTVELFGRPVWLGWLMLPALLWTAAPCVLLGRAKLKLARLLHDKTLHADAMMNQADWLSGMAAMIGIVGIGWGWWWTDAVAAAIISLDVAYDGCKNIQAVTGDLMDRTPRTVDNRVAEALPARLVTELKKLDWVRDAQVRLRENGHVFFGEVFLAPKDHRDLMARSDKALQIAYAVDWRLQELVVQMSDDLPTEASDADQTVTDEARTSRRAGVSSNGCD
jgi:cation diffusion facilitator family transporter